MKLPPLRAVQYFAVVARLNSFSKASDELCVTQSAVSHQVKLLEQYLGEALFDRSGRRFSLSPLGERYFEEVNNALMSISHASQKMREGESGQIRLAVYSSLAVKWLIPRLDYLKQQHPEIDLTLNMVSGDPELSDELADCFITVLPPKSHYVCQFLYKELLYPICSKKLWQQIHDQPLPQALWNLPLLSVRSAFEHHKPGEDWRKWAKLGHFTVPDNVQVSHFSHMILASEAARYDQGIALLNNYFISDQDRQQSFVRIPMHDLPTGDSFYFVYKKTRANQSEMISLGRWLKQQCYDQDVE